MAAHQASSNVLSSTANILTYHCLCTQLSLATTTPLETLPKRQIDAAAIATCGDFAAPTRPSLTMQALSADEKATIVKLEDGFEKRYPVRCTRCGPMSSTASRDCVGRRCVAIDGAAAPPSRFAVVHRT